MTSMIGALLFDLDNTLLENEIDAFISAYLAALRAYMSAHLPVDAFVPHLLQATQAMVANEDPNRTNAEVFDAAFFPAFGRTREELAPLFDDFYATRFADLRSLTRPDPATRSLLEWAFEQGVPVVIATNPLFPRTAIEQRLAWAGVPVDRFPYALVTSYEEMHAAKPNPAYYLEIAGRLGQPPEACLMVGDEWEQDVGPALSVGMVAFWISGPDQGVPEGAPAPAGRGRLADFARWVRGVV
ncbi:MAG: HAD family hydrolase [Anaerolineae bacterium]|nr:HAD family hydrolase [Anaerolineae bacterium]